MPELRRGWQEPSAEDEYFVDEDEGLERPGLPEIILAMDALTERQQLVLKLRFGLTDERAALTYQEIATLMGLDWTTVREYEQAGLTRLRKLLENTP